MRKSDKRLGMHADISRRDLLHDAAMVTAALTLGPGAAVAAQAADSPMEEDAGTARTPGTPIAEDYPPVRTGLRGSHPGAYEAAHAIAREGKSFPRPTTFDEHYDLVVVGAGISGLAAAYYYGQRFGDSARILLLENHDDFGGHARRNEFHQGGKMRLSMGGTHNLEWWSFSRDVKRFLRKHGVDWKRMRKDMQFEYGRSAKNGAATWFDADTYGVNRLLTDCDLASATGPAPGLIDQIPISTAGRESLKKLYSAKTDVLKDRSGRETENYLRSISYPEFLREHCGVTDDAVQLFAKLEHGGWGVELRAMSAMEGLEAGLPGANFLGRKPSQDAWDYPVAMWPDGNASLARLQVARLIPGVAPGTTADNIAVASFDYSELDKPENRVRLRLNSTVVNVKNRGDGVDIAYASADGRTVHGVSARHCVLACYHSIIPHLCPELEKAQAEALRYQVKHPLLMTNVLIRNTDALDKLGIDGVRCPGRIHSHFFTFRGINTGGYEHDIEDSGPVSLNFWGSISPPASAVDLKSQLRASRAIMLGLNFEDYEREVRSVLDALLGPAGFDVERDILAITVNRWPHGYAYAYLDLWDPEWPEGEAPHEIARQPFGRVAIANADAAADAYTHA
ncbi:MAG: FAD/NAD(P)-binding protein, partial [Pseudomonadota bacterium]